MNAMGEPAVHIEALSFGWRGRRPLISIAGLRIERGEKVLLVGPSGSGKSSLIGLLTGVIRPQSGRVAILGQDITAMRAGERDRFRGRSIGLIFQMFNLIPYLTVMDNIVLPKLFGRRWDGEERDADRAEALRLLGALGLTDPAIADTPVTELSQGQQQRTAAARALFGRPGLLIADEPTSALDTDTRDQFLDLLAAEAQAAGTTLLIASHDPGLAPHFNRISRMAELRGADA